MQFSSSFFPFLPPSLSPSLPPSLPPSFPSSLSIFQSVCKGLPSFVTVCRVLMDMRRRLPDWAGLSTWVRMSRKWTSLLRLFPCSIFTCTLLLCLQIIELLVKNCIATANPDFCRPGDIFRRVIECMASGLFLPGGCTREGSVCVCVCVCVRVFFCHPGDVF